MFLNFEAVTMIGTKCRDRKKLTSAIPTTGESDG